MKIACPHCTQHIEIDRTWSGKQLCCPTCGGMIAVPVFGEARAGKVSLPPQAKPAAVRRPFQPPPKRAPIGILVAAVTVVLLAGWWWIFSAGRAPSAADDKAVSAATNGTMRQEAASAGEGPMAEAVAVNVASVDGPVAANDAAESSTAEMAMAAGKQVIKYDTAASDASAGAGLMEQVAADRELWPTEVKLMEETLFPAVFQGRPVGQVKVPAGTAVEVVAITTEDVTVRFRDGQLRLPHRSTNLAAVASARKQDPQRRADKVSLAPSPSAAPATQPKVDASLLAAAEKIDGLIRTSLTKKRLKPPASIDDERFLRRAYVVAVGRIPTAEEASEFLADKDPHKRANLVDRLVRSPGYASQMTNWIFDRLRIVDYNRVAQIRYPIYRQWVRAAVEQNMPWNKMVTSLLTGQGGGWDESTAPVGYFTRDRGMPLDNLAITMRVFLGARMECAQCHNDPFGDTKQKDFFRLAAFTNGQEPMKQDLFRGIFAEMNALSRETVEHQAAWMFWRDVYGNSLAGGGTGRIALPQDYRYKDARPGDIEGARVPFGRAVSTTGRRERDDGRAKLAAWMTEGTGERFPAMIANSMWKKVMGTGLFEPDDEYIELPETHEPDISKHLADLMVALGYDLRNYQEVLMLTDAFAAAPNPSPSVAVGGAEDFLGRRVQRLSAEQVWDSLVTLIAGNPDGQPSRAIDNRILFEGRPVLEGRMTMTQLSREVLAIEDEKTLREYFAKFVDKVKSSQEQPADADGAMSTMQHDPVGFVRAAYPRASELPSPAPRDHFVSLFGQSNREIVGGSTREPNMGQVLSLMNGFVQRELIARPKAHLNADLESVETPDEKIRRLYLSIFSREPASAETAEMRAEFEASPESAPANIASAMIMSAEFLYLQ